MEETELSSCVVEVEASPDEADPRLSARSAPRGPSAESPRVNPPPSGETPPWRTAPARVIVILPAYNEEENLPRLLQRIDQACFEAGIAYETIVVDDGSSDRTAKVARSFAKHMPVHVVAHERNQGLGAAIRDGLRAAARRAGDHDIVVVMDADNSHTPGLILSMTRSIQEGADVVIASRFREGAYVRGVPFCRQLLSLGARILMQIVFPTKGVRDYTCGYRAYRSAILKEAFRRYGEGFVNQEGFQCMVDVLLKLRSMDAVFREVPLILRYDLKAGSSKMRVFRTIRNTLRLLFRRRLGLS